MQNRTHSTARRLLGEFSPYRMSIAAVLLLGLVISAVQPASVKITQLIIDHLQADRKSAFPTWLPLALVGIFVISGIAKYLYNVLRRSLCEKVLVRFREALFDKYLHLPQPHLDRVKTGEMLSSIQNDLQQLSSGFDTIWDLFKEPFTFLGLIGAAFYFDWRLALATVIVVPSVIWLFSWSGASVKRYMSKNLVQFSELVSLCQEVLVGSRVVKVFGLEKVLSDRFNTIQRQYFATALQSIRVQEITTPLVELIGAGLMASVIAYGAMQTGEGALSAGDLIGFVIALGLAQMPIKQMNNAHLKLRAAEAAADRVYQLLDVPSVRSVSLRKAVFEKSIRYENVFLSYGKHEALRGVSFELKCGQKLALVGQSGGGKTSIVNLLPRLYEATAGKILIDGKDTRSMDLAELRSLLSYVTQDVFLFNESVFENVRYGNPAASSDEVWQALEHANCREFVSRLPEKEHTLLGDRGMRLSGGERQRIAIARAFLKSAPILILDEATSSLDSGSEKAVQAALDELIEGRTALIVAHRFSTIQQADSIIVVERGVVQEQGTHASLLEKQGVYQALFQHQAWSHAPVASL